MFGQDRGSEVGDAAGESGDVISVIGVGMTVDGNCVSEGSVRVEGRVEGRVEAAKSVVVGEEGEVVGDVVTQDAVVAGTVRGTLRADSRVELKATCRVQGDIESGTVELAEGGQVDGELRMTEEARRESGPAGAGSSPDRASRPEKGEKTDSGEPREGAEATA